MFGYLLVFMSFVRIFSLAYLVTFLYDNKISLSASIPSSPLTCLECPMVPKRRVKARVRIQRVDYNN